MAIEFMDGLKDLASMASFVLLPIWKAISGVKEELTQTNLTLAKDYMTKTECDKKHEGCSRHHESTEAEFRRVYDKIDKIGGAK